MPDQVKRKESKALQTQVEVMAKQSGIFINKTFEERVSGDQGDKVTEQ
jgi:hypothetical protein